MSPILLAIAAMVKWSSSGEILYSQERIGRGGVPFALEISDNARQRGRTAASFSAKRLPTSQAVGSASKDPNDPRVIPWVGHFLRRSSLDELPQLWNVLRGEMSIVGPRPLPRYHLDDFDDAFLNRRHAIAPGMTGLWQRSSAVGTALPKCSLNGTRITSKIGRRGSTCTSLHVPVRTVVSGEGAS